MTLNILLIIILVTVLISINAFNNETLKYKMLNIPYRVKHNKESYRLFSHMFVHADYAHLAFNMFSLYMLGNLFLNAGNQFVGVDQGLVSTYGFIEGQVHFLALYILGGLFATVFPFIRNKDNEMYMSLGASGAVSAVVFGAIMWNPTMELGLLFIPFYIPAYIFGPLYILLEIYLDRRGGSNIAHDAHIGGALFGILYVLLINPEKGTEFLQLITG